MFGSDHSKRLIDLFAAQFTPEGSGFLYRRNQVGAGYLVSVAERDAFVAAHRREWRRIFWAAILGVVVVVGAMVALFEEPHKGVTIAATIVLIGFLTLLHLWAWRRPERALALRVPSLPALDRGAARRKNLSQVTWGNLALSPVFALVLGSRAWGDDGVHGWSALWLVAAVGLMGMSAVQAWRKWRVERVG
ncbi:hypothetical protein HRV97_01285 [Sphingomonas sp. HHU CXW]|uniref:Uncharacterized protein n=1 Tax=Sphingomonas hominis TaxID=2741495 RepID=A0ABX2JL04_9SPHN|nr:hypothetical protein [Sphingomonas hominis]NTS63792.1 hypothetical protein [Sphingomonas hominis]